MKRYITGCFTTKKNTCMAILIMLAGIWLAGCGAQGTEIMSYSMTGDEGTGQKKQTEDSSQQEGAGDSSQEEWAGDSSQQVGERESSSQQGKESGSGLQQEEQTGTEALKHKGSSVSDNDSGISQNETEADDRAETVDEEDLKIAKEMRQEPVKVKGIYVSGPVAGIAKMDDLIDLVDRTELNAMVIDIKNDEGKVTYKMQSEQVLEIESGVAYIPDIKELVAKCKEKNIYLIARIVAFRDPYLAEQNPEWAVHTKEGEIFRDKSGLAWVNPYEREAWDYLLEIASQAAKDGFDEIQFDYIRFSTDIREEEVDYGPEEETADKVEIITEFTEYMYKNLVPQGVYVAADVFGTVIDNEIDQKIVGQDYVRMAEHLDYLCPMVYPSHYHNGAYGISVPDAQPYDTIYAASSSSVQQLQTMPEKDHAHVRMWLQSFTASWVPGHIKYGAKQIREQIKGAYDAGYDEWILWNAAVNYQPDSLLSEEAAEEERLRWEEEKKASETPETVSGNGT